MSNHARAALAAALLATPVTAASAGSPMVNTEGARPFFEELLPRALVQLGPRGLLWWQWLALPLVIAFSLLAGWLLGLATRAILARLAARTRTTWDDVIIARTAGPLAALWAVASLTALQPWLLFGPGPEATLERTLRAATYLAVFWGGFRLIDVAFQAAAGAPWSRANAGLTGLLPLGRRVARIVLLAIGAVSVLNELGFQVASLLAGLGIGGVALALAAQKTVENLFGSLSIGVDQPFRVGDFVKVEDFVGTVESIGMRSTRFRTLDRTVITIPNGKLADSRTETFATRDRIRLYANLGLSYETTAEQMRAVLAGIEAALAAHPRVAPVPPSVRFTDFRDSTLNVEVMAWFATADWNEFTRIRQDLFLDFMAIVQRAGASFAFPTRTVRVVDERARPDGAQAGGRAR